MENGAISGILVEFTGKQEFYQTSPLCQFQLLINQQLHAKYEKNLMKQSWENYISMVNGAISGIFGPIYGQTRIFPN